MVFDRIFNRNDKESEIESEPSNNQRFEGKIYHLSDQGWGFISSHDIPFTRIYFHWTGLLGDTLKFTELNKGDRVEFTHIQVKNENDGKMQDRAIKIKVL